MKGFIEEFKSFLLKGNVMDMAVGFIFGAAFSTVVKSLVNNIVMPPIGMLLGKVDFSALYIPLDGGHYESLVAAEEASAPLIKYGVFINDVIGFVILGFVVFMMIKTVGKLRAKEEEKEAAAPKKSDEVKVLEEIRDALAK
jgi:large conductance mechanosensitive channel